MGASKLRSHRSWPRGRPHHQHADSFRKNPEPRCCAGGDGPKGKFMSRTDSRPPTRQDAPGARPRRPGPPGRRRAPQSARILGAHEYGDHTVIRAFRPHAIDVVAIVGDDRFPLQHLDSGLFAVALPFSRPHRLPAAGELSGRTRIPLPTPTASCPPWAKSTCTCSPRAATSDSGKSLAPTRARSPRPTA